MARYLVREGAQLSHDGTVHTSGAIIEMPAAIATDIAVAGLVDELDADGQLVAPRPPDALARFKSHERIGFLAEQRRAALAEAARLQALIDAEEANLAAHVRAHERATADEPVEA